MGGDAVKPSAEWTKALTLELIAYRFGLALAVGFFAIWLTAVALRASRDMETESAERAAPVLVLDEAAHRQAKRDLAFLKSRVAGTEECLERAEIVVDWEEKAGDNDGDQGIQGSVRD